MGKKFSRCIRPDTVGTCPRIICWRSLRATNFTSWTTLTHGECRTYRDQNRVTEKSLSHNCTAFSALWRLGQFPACFAIANHKCVVFSERRPRPARYFAKLDKAPVGHIRFA